MALDHSGVWKGMLKGDLDAVKTFLDPEFVDGSYRNERLREDWDKLKNYGKVESAEPGAWAFGDLVLDPNQGNLAQQQQLAMMGQNQPMMMTPQQQQFFV